MKKARGNGSGYIDIFIRYLLLVLVAIPNLWIFYKIFTPLTIYPVYYVLKQFVAVTLVSNILIINGTIAIEIIRACVAGSAYYFLLILNLSTPGITFSRRIKMIFFAFISFLIINVIRIIVLSLIFFEGLPGFIITHQILWYVMSTIFVVGIWFVQVKIFGVKEIPVYSDLKHLYGKTF